MFGRRTPQPTDDSNTAPVERGTEPIALVTPDEVLEGWTRPHDRRLTELLNAGAPLPVELCGERDVPEWQDFAPQDLVAVVPMPLPPSRRQVGGSVRSSVIIRSHRFEIRGVAHVPSGADEERYLLDPDKPWLPLTEATIRVNGDEWAARVVIANLDHATELVRSA